VVERTRALDIACHGILILGGLLVCVPIYFAFVVGSHTVRDVLAVPPPWLPGTRFFENAQTAWQKGNLGRLLFNSLVVALGIMIGKIAVSLLSAFAISYFRFRYRMAAFWLIFVSLMLPVEVRILPTYEVVTNVALPLQWLVDWLRDRDHPEWNMMNSYGGLILPLIASATATFLFRQFFLTVPESRARPPASTAPRRCISSATSCRRCRCRTWWRCRSSSSFYGWNQYLWPLLSPRRRIWRPR
jgi:sn-glycerol 3-phosphate transport system permease protein